MGVVAINNASPGGFTKTKQSQSSGLSIQLKSLFETKGSAKTNPRQGEDSAKGGNYSSPCPKGFSKTQEIQESEQAQN